MDDQYTHNISTSVGKAPNGMSTYTVTRDGQTMYSGMSEIEAKNVTNKLVKQDTETYWKSDEYQEWKQNNPEEAAQQEANMHDEWQKQGIEEKQDVYTDEDRELAEEMGWDLDEDGQQEQETQQEQPQEPKTQITENTNIPQSTPQTNTNKTEQPQQQSKTNNELVPPLNPTDPIVHHDRSKAFDHIVTLNEESDNSTDGNNPKPDTLTDSKHVNGIFFPLVNLNGLVINKDNIQEMIIQIKDFAPTLYLTIYDEHREIVGINRPTMNNFVSIIMVPPVDGVYKSISMKFYIKSFEMIGENLWCYTGTYHWMELYNQSTRAITFPGCSAKECGRSENKKPTTWEYLHVIAMENGLGFSSTEDCKKHEDKLPRLVQAKTLVDFIDEHIKFGGKDKDHIFDVFIDEYGYLTMINLPWVFNYKINPNSLAINKITSVPQSTKKLPEPKSKQVHRTITNWNNFPEYSNDLYIDWYEQINNNASTFFDGTSIQMFGFKPEGSDCKNVNGSEGNNAFAQQDFQIQEDSIVGQDLSEYNTSTRIVVKPEYNAYQTELQKIVRDNYLKKLKTKMLKVRMKDMNFGLHRGILVNVAIFTDQAGLKTTFMNSYTNVDSNNKLNPDTNTIGTEKYEIQTKAQLMAPDPWLSGIYYIAGVEYVFDPYATGSSDQAYKDWVNNEIKHSDDHLLQYLYLIRKVDPDSPKGWKRAVKANFDSIVNSDWI